MADTWYWPQALDDNGFTGGPTSTGWEPHNFNYGAAITIAAAGTATKIAVRCNAGTGTPTLKLGLYNSAKNLLAQSTVVNGAATAWREATISVAVSSGTHYVLVSSSDTNSAYFYNTGFTGVAATVNYAASMAASVTTSDEANLLYAVKVWVVDATATLDQYGYRARNDDGSETTATWKAAQNTTWTIVPDERFRLRLGVNATNDPASKALKLQYRIAGGSWRDVDKTG